MKTILIFVIILFGVSLKLKCQAETGVSLELKFKPDTIVVGKNWYQPNEIKIDTLYVKGKLVQFEFDTLFFVNQILLNDYSNTINNYNELLKLCNGTIDYMAIIHKQMVTDLSSFFNDTNKSLKYALDSLALNNKRLDKWKAENSNLISINNKLSIDLNLAKEQIKSEKWNSLGKKMLFGGGGVIVGTGLSALIILIAK